MLDRLSRVLNHYALWVGGLSILAISLLGGLDTITTLAFGQPIPIVFEATQTLMVFAVFLGLGEIHRRRDHIGVDLVYGAMPERGKHAVDLLTLVLMLGFFGAIAWRGWISAAQSWWVGEYMPGILPFPIYPAKFALAVGASLAVLACVVDLARGGRLGPPKGE